MKNTSFSAIQKAEIVDQQNKNACCRRALVDGVLCAKAFVSDRHIELSLENDLLADYISSSISDVFSCEVEKRIPKKGGRCRVLSFRSNSAIKYIQKNAESRSFLDVCRQKCHTCHNWFWRGVFISSGRISDPEKQNCLEFSLAERVPLFYALFQEQGLSPRMVERKTEKIIYFKNGSAIQDFFALAGMNNTVFALIESSIKSDSRNNANRISNCETHNITRAVDASQRYMNAIQDLMTAQLLTSLPDELEQTARLRVEHADLSLSQLAQVSVPPITKSGLSHRLNKILAVAEQRLGKKYR